MSNKIVIAGGTGFVGKYLTKQFGNLGYQVIIISRQKENIQWNDTTGIINALENSALLINLAGKSVDCRYNEKNKSEILRSRTETTMALGEAILKCKHPPDLWINSSTATIYRHAEDMPMTEDEGEIGSGFSVDVAKNWEQSFFSFHLPVTRQVALRMAIVLGKNGGVMKPLINLVRFGLGGKQGNGNQMFSWIHIEDLFNITLFFKSHEELEGVYNCSSPNPINNKTLMKTLRQTMKVKIGLPSPAWLLKVGAVIIKTEPELILKSRWVVPEKLLKAGYIFKYATLGGALKNIVNNEQ
ncbi:MAG TPA: TIGR01777 family oxidoreductase [Chitinophagaceae bacterium]|nr:TIGR01777 family oxidoreductase [Chitinophagaceae bacterium]